MAGGRPAARRVIRGLARPSKLNTKSLSRNRPKEEVDGAISATLIRHFCVRPFEKTTPTGICLQTVCKLPP